MRIGFTGHRPSSLNDQYDFFSEFRKDLRVSIYDHIELILRDINTPKDITFYSGMALGFDIDCAHSVIQLRRRNNHLYNISLVAVIPSDNQSNLWRSADISIYNNLMLKCDEIINMSKMYHNLHFSHLLQKRNEYIVDNSDMLLYLWNGNKAGGTYHCIRYALQQSKYCMPIELSDDLKQQLGWGK